jgi:glycerophosphoryl diester phosphodiesterase
MAKKIITIVLSIAIVQVTNAQYKVLKKFPKSKNSIIVIAHRGDHEIAPENSLLSLQNAIADGVDYVEIDLRTTKDSQLVLLHDETVDRMTNGVGKVAEMNLDKIKSLKLFNKKIDNSDTLAIPTFVEALKVCKGKVNIYLDFKNANVQQTMEEIAKQQMQDQIVVYINSPKQYMDWVKYAPSIPLILSLNRKINDSATMVNYVNNLHIDILDGSWTEYNTTTVNAAKLQNIPVWADMQSLEEDESYWLKGIELGIKGIQTDHPKKLVQYIKKRSFDLAKPIKKS